ncbi:MULTISPECIES: VOC family protein [Micromonospora]|nr:VOC family protein [Micromonospora yangpuensis]
MGDLPPAQRAASPIEDRFEPAPAGDPFAPTAPDAPFEPAPAEERFEPTPADDRFVPTAADDHFVSAPADERFVSAPADERFESAAPADGPFTPDVPEDRFAASATGPRAAAGPWDGEPDPIDLPLDDPPAARVHPSAASAHPSAPVHPDDLDPAIFGYPSDVADGPISGVGITVLVTDLDRSLDFYRDVLGFTEVDRGAGNAVLASGSTRLVLREVSEAAPISRRLVHVNLEVNDIQAAYERLRDTGLRFTYAPRVVNRGTKLEVWAAAFRDPDGHGIALTQWRALTGA